MKKPFDIKNFDKSEFNIEKIKNFSISKFKQVIGSMDRYKHLSDDELKSLFEKLTNKKSGGNK